MAGILSKRVSVKKVLLLLGFISCYELIVLLCNRGLLRQGYLRLDQTICGSIDLRNQDAFGQTTGTNGSFLKVLPSVTPIINPGLCDQQNKNVSELIKQMKNVVVLEKQKLLFCYVPKVACTNWKRILLVLQGNLTLTDKPSHMTVHRTADRSLKSISGMVPSKAKQALANYTKIMFVRDPFSRMLSAYRDKLESSGRPDSDRFRKYWSKIMRDTANKENRGQYDISFKEFTSYLANPANKLGRGEEEHWRPIHQLCQPCTIQYDFIGKFENLEHDTNYALTELIHSNLSIGLMNSTNFTNSSDIDLIGNYYSRLSLRTLRGLYKRYQFDLELFQYPSLEYLWKMIQSK